jgi:hypothetical protein
MRDGVTAASGCLGDDQVDRANRDPRTRQARCELSIAGVSLTIIPSCAANSSTGGRLAGSKFRQRSIVEARDGDTRRERRTGLGRQRMARTWVVDDSSQVSLAGSPVAIS